MIKHLRWIIPLAIVGFIGLVLIFIIFGSYNGLVRADVGADEAWANVETQYQRRYDLIPNLVNTVQGFADQELEVFTEVTRLRSQWQTAPTVNQKIDTSNQLESALSKLLLVQENYPQLKSNENFLRLQDELTGTENRINVARTRYNEAVRTYNVKTRTFPSNIVAGLFGFESKEFFEADSGAENAPTVEF